MAQKTIAGVSIEVTDEGYLADATQWTKEIATEIAKEENISLTDKHFDIIEFIRNKFEKGEGLTIRSIGKSGVIDIKGFYGLFPGAPLKNATKIAGIPRPESCV